MIFTSESFSTMGTFEWFQTSMNELMFDTVASVCESTSANLKNIFKIETEPYLGLVPGISDIGIGGLDLADISGF